MRGSASRGAALVDEGCFAAEEAGVQVVAGGREDREVDAGARDAADAFLPLKKRALMPLPAVVGAAPLGSFE